MKIHDAIIVGGGPAGLSAALALGRARKRVLLLDAGPRRNAAAVHVHNFLTRDGTPPAEMRRIGGEQLAQYPSVEARDQGAEDIRGEKGAFEVQLASGHVERARRVVLATGMIDVLPEIEGFRALWGRSIFQCPYCHGWEVRDLRFGVLVTRPERLEFALMLKAWSPAVTVLADAAIELPEEGRMRLEKARIPIERRPIARLIAGEDGGLARVAFREGPALELDVLFAHPPQRQVPVIERLGPKLDAAGFVEVHPMFRETSIPGVYAAGDLATGQQAAVIAAAAGMQAAAALNHDLTVEQALAGG